MNLQQIAEGWTNLAKKHLKIADDKTERLAVNRYAKCLQCEFQQRQTLICKKCGCYTPSKVRASEQKCPIAKW